MKELLEVLNIRRSRGKTIGECRLLEYLVKKHTETHIQIGHEQGLGLTGIMNEVKATQPHHNDADKLYFQLALIAMM